jgi:hypothetical protein
MSDGWEKLSLESKRGRLVRREELPRPPRCVTIPELAAHLGVHYLVARKVIQQAIKRHRVRVHELPGRGGPKAYEWIGKPPVLTSPNP